MGDLVLDAQSLGRVRDGLDVVAAEVWFTIFVYPDVLRFFCFVGCYDCPGTWRLRFSFGFFLVVWKDGREVAARFEPRSVDRRLGLPAPASERTESCAWTRVRCRTSVGR